MEGWEVFLIILLILLVLTGVVVTIYFVLRHDDKKNKEMQPTGGGNGGTTPSGPSGPTGTTPSGPTGTTPPGPSGPTGTTPPGPSGPTGITPPGPSGPTGTVPPKNQDISISVNQNKRYKASVSNESGYTRSVFAYNLLEQSVNNSCNSYSWQHKDVTRNNINVPNALEFQYNPPGKGILYPTDDTISVTVGGQVQTAKKLGIDNNNISVAKGIDASWIFKDSKICLQNKPHLCLFVEDSDVSGTFSTMVLANNSNSTDVGFLWDTGPLPTPSDGCTAN